MDIAVLDCPHCKKNIIRKNTGWYYKLDTPLRNCPHCGGEYLYPYTIEWGIAGIFFRVYYCFFANGNCAPAIMLVTGLVNRDLWDALIWGSIWIGFCVGRLLIFDRKHIKASYERTKDNPAYIQKLSDLGYARIDIRLDPYYK